MKQNFMRGAHRAAMMNYLNKHKVNWVLYRNEFFI